MERAIEWMSKLTDVLITRYKMSTKYYIVRYQITTKMLRELVRWEEL